MSRRKKQTEIASCSLASKTASTGVLATRIGKLQEIAKESEGWLCRLEEIGMRCLGSGRKRDDGVVSCSVDETIGSWGFNSAANASINVYIHAVLG